jgi:hypothetical protein
MNYPKWNPDDTIATLTLQPVVINSMQDFIKMNIEDRARFGNPIVDELTDLDDIDDDINMDIDEPITSKLPDRNFNIRTLSNDMLNEMRND